MKSFALGLAVAAAALAGSASAATIRSHVISMKSSGKPEVFSIENGVYTCSSCQPEVKIKADGYSHKVASNPDYDELVVKVLSPHSIEIVEQSNHKNRAFKGYNLSQDGKSLTVTFDDYATGKEDKGGYKSSRVSAPPPPQGALPISGSWKVEQMTDGKPEATSQPR